MADKLRILIVDDEENMRHMLKVLLEKEGYVCEAGADGQEALKKFEQDPYDFVLCDIRMPRMDGSELLREMRRRQIPATVIMMSAYGSEDTALEAMKLGAYDYISKPFKAEEIVLTLKKAEERERLQKENLLLRRQVLKEYGFGNIITKNERMQEILQTITKIAEYKSTVLIVGESGTGKELIAKALHYSSLRRDGPFVPVNCGAIPENLLESELFGHVRGAFTDASYTKKGLFEEADGGTLFLDEIGELPLLLQVKLLRVLQEEEVRRVGDTKPIRVNVRIIAATIRDLAEEVKKGSFRSDLYYRLNVLALQLPPLRERRDDIPTLVDAFIERYNYRLQRQIKGISKEALGILMDYNWEGNVRELENAIERAMALAEGNRIEVHNLPPQLREVKTGGELTIPDYEYSIKKVNRQVEEELIRRALRRTGGNRTQAAKLLEISHRALLYKIKDFGIEEER
ncbi:MAG: histidine kinase [Deltaproteobacteria bacterium RBG_13_61_14]|nr:MAG: histidine kinase [Deltaproteobacteria bacterium RBG_13_61_14]